MATSMIEQQQNQQQLAAMISGGSQQNAKLRNFNSPNNTNMPQVMMPHGQGSDELDSSDDDDHFPPS